MDHHRLHDIIKLAEILEAEACGRPFDRAHAHHLAVSLAKDQPEIGNSLRQIAERLGERRN